MGVRTTASEGKVALFDSVTGTAFGPVFDDPFDAEEFLRWLQGKSEEEAQFGVGDELVTFRPDARVYTNPELQIVMNLYISERGLE